MKVNNFYNMYYGVTSREVTPIQPQLFCEQTDDLISEIFAPSPFNGFPCNALSLVIHSGVSKEVQEFVKQNLLQVLPPKGFAPDEETADKTMRLNSEQYGNEVDEYFGRLQEFVESVSNQNNDSVV